jgi:RNA polymerase sigma-70 factor (ECF subfamily)
MTTRNTFLRLCCPPGPNAVRWTARVGPAEVGRELCTHLQGLGIRVLYRVARNVIIDERRSARFRREVRSPDPTDGFEQRGPDEVDAALDRLLIADALMHLSPEHRAVVRRSHYLGWTIAQIADDLQIPEGTVKSRLHYALHALRLTLQEMGVTR